MKMNRRMLFGIISIALAAVIALIGIPAVIGQSNTKINIVRVKTAIEEGSVIAADSLEMLLRSACQCSYRYVPGGGTYDLVDLVPGDYFLPSKVSSTIPDRDPILSMLPDDKIAVSMSVQSLAGILSNKLRTDDIVAIYSYNDDGKIEAAEELQYVRIIAISNSGGTNIEDATGDESRMASTITLKVHFEEFITESELINANTVSALNRLKLKIPNYIFHEWVNALIRCQSDRTMKNTLLSIIQKFSDVRVVQSELDASVASIKREAFMMMGLVIINVPLLYVINHDWFMTLVYSLQGKITLAVCAGIVLFSFMRIMKLSAPIEYKGV